MSRPPKDEVFLRMAVELSRLSTCHRLHVGCILIDKHGQVDGTGFNGRASGLPHCNEVRAEPQYAPVGAVVPGLVEGSLAVERRLVGVTESLPFRCRDSDAPSGAPNGCESVHAEQNALMQCSDRFNIATAFVTHSPCLPCVKMLLNTSAKRVVFLYEYPAREAMVLWEGAGRAWEKLPLSF